MGASAEIFAGVVRGGPDHHRHGDPYEWFAHFRSHPDLFGVAVVGPAGHEAVKAHEEVFTCLRALGFSRVRWWRMKGGKPVLREYEL